MESIFPLVDHSRKIASMISSSVVDVHRAPTLPLSNVTMSTGLTTSNFCFLVFFLEGGKSTCCKMLVNEFALCNTARTFLPILFWKRVCHLFNLFSPLQCSKDWRNFLVLFFFPFFSDSDLDRCGIVIFYASFDAAELFRLVNEKSGDCKQNKQKEY